ETGLTLNLRKGTNKIKMISLTSVGGPNLDKITIAGGEPGNPEYELAVNIQGKGTVLRDPDAPFYEAGTVVTLTAVPNETFQALFVGWSGDASGNSLTTQVTMNSKKTITATFRSSVHASYYCAPVAKDGNDNNSGTIDQPFYNLKKALALMEPGDTVFLRGGVYDYTETIPLDKFGSEVERICIFAFENEIPVLDFYGTGGSRGNARGFKVTGNYYHMKGLEICYAPDNGIKVEGSYNIFELLRLHHNGDSGIQIGLGSNDPDGPDIVCFNLVKNCDSWRNLDWGTNYENADGFACKLSPGPGNRFVGCRAWQNADDGWDFYMTHYPIYIDSCWTYGNGNAEIINIDQEWKARYPDAPSNWQGDGNGFKLGGDGWPAKHQVSNCIAFDGYVTGAGFSENNNADSLFLYNCVAWYGVKNFRIRAYPSDLRNCISFDSKTGGEGQIRDIAAGSVEMNNSWNEIDGETLVPPRKDANGNMFDQKSIYSEFVSTSVDDFHAPREPDGSLPNNGFGRLRPGSRFIDKGTPNVRGVSAQTYHQIPLIIPYTGSAPDLGAYESGVITNIQMPNFSDEPVFSNYPNPVRTTTTFTAVAQEKGRACIYLCDITGKKLKTICDRYVTKNEPVREVLNASDLEKGIYMAVFKNGKTQQVRKMVCVK
ncbi:MAG: T9SS type A sorting domain-containing protein, partial [Dysgonamonadaceae bacterium]|nr:T9SS type A sorting domain-containing protein [Dysgonamonadaceae bacterium]